MEKLEKENQIRKYFDFYQKKVLPVVEKYATQKKKGYHGLYTHTDAVVFRAIDYALELGKNPLPVLFAAACHDMAKISDGYDEKHGEKALPLAKKVMAEFRRKLSATEKKNILTAIKDHTIGMQTSDYISACLWDADRTRLSWERGYYEKYFNTDYGKQVASGNAIQYIMWQNKVLGRVSNKRIQNTDWSKEKLSLVMKKLNDLLKR